MPERTEKRPRAWMVWGMHGGYGLNGQKDTAKAVRKMAEQARAFPQTVFTMEFEPYALDRMANGARLKMEKAVKGVTYKDPASLAVFQDLVRQRRLQIVGTYTQPLLFLTEEEAIVRQFAAAKRIVRDTLGLEIDSYWVQEPCWCGQLPGILRQFGIAHCVFSNAWTCFGTAPQRNAGKVRWRGPDGATVWTLPRRPYATPWKEEVEYGREPHGYWSRSDEPALYQLKWAALSGHRTPVFESLASDFFEGRSATPYEKLTDDIDLRCATIPQLMRMLPDDGLWDDAYAEFREQFPWGLQGGGALLHMQQATDRANRQARLAAIAGRADAKTLRNLWELAMLAEHHDMLALPAAWPHPQFGVHYGQLPATCNAESAAIVAQAERPPSGPVFSVINPTQLGRCEWTRAVFTPARGALHGAHVGVAAAVSRLVVTERHDDGSARRIEGAFLATVPPFAATRYALRAVETPTTAPALPLQVKVEGESVEIVSGALTFRLDRKAAVLKRRGYRVLRNIRLAGNVDGQPEVSRFERVGAQEMPDGCAAAWAEGFVGSLPVKVTFRFAPWSLRMDVEVQCQVNGQRIEGRRWDDTTGALKIVFEHGRLSVYRCHEPFELRQPAGVHAHAVQFFVTEWRDTASGFVTVLDRPSGLLLDDLQAAVALCRRGRYEYGDKMPDGEKIDNAEGAFTYRLGVVPFYAHELPDALREYQKLAYPLAITARAENRLGIEVQGHSVISGLCPEPDGSAALRVWNPLATDRFRIEAPGYDLARCRFDGTGRTPWAHDALTSRIAPMQFTQFLLRKRSRTRRANP